MKYSTTPCEVLDPLKLIWNFISHSLLRNLTPLQYNKKQFKKKSLSQAANTKGNSEMLNMWKSHILWSLQSQLTWFAGIGIPTRQFVEPWLNKSKSAIPIWTPAKFSINLFSLIKRTVPTPHFAEQYVLKSYKVT